MCVAIHVLIKHNVFSGQPCKAGEARLVGGPSPSVGLVEICLDEKWGMVCNSSLDLWEATIICRQLGYLPVGK